MKNTGWIFKFKGSNCYEATWGRTKSLRSAWVVPSRGLAREIKSRYFSVLKVKLDKRGKAVRIIGRG